MPRSVLELHSRSLKVDKSDEGPNSSSGLVNDELSVNRSSGVHQDTDLTDTRAGQREHHTKVSSFDDVVLSNSSLNFRSPYSPYNGSIFSYCPSLLFLPQSKLCRDEHSISHCSPFLEQPDILAGHCSCLYLQESPSFSILLASYHFLSWRAANSHIVEYPQKIGFVDASALSNVPLAQQS